MDENQWLILIPIGIMIAVATAWVVMIKKYGCKGMQFGYRILDTDRTYIISQCPKRSYTIQLHKLDSEKLYGLEIQQLSGSGESASAFTIPEDKLLELRDRISEYVKENQSRTPAESTSEVI